MDFLERFDPATLDGVAPIAESDQFAIYPLKDATYLLVQRHSGTP